MKVSERDAKGMNQEERLSHMEKMEPCHELEARMSTLGQQIGWFLNYTLMVSPYFEGKEYLDINGPPTPYVKQQNEMIVVTLVMTLVTLVLTVTLTVAAGMVSVQVN